MSKLNIPQITEEQMIKFFGDDTPEEIARYMANNITNLAQGFTTPLEFLDMHIPEEDENE